MLTLSRETGGDSLGSCIECPQGKYCEEGTAEPVDCAKGRWCGAGSVSESDDEHGMYM